MLHKKVVSLLVLGLLLVFGNPPAHAFLFGVIGDSLSTAGNTDDVCDDAFECLENMGTGRRFSFAHGHEPWSLLNRLKAIEPELSTAESVAENGKRWRDAPGQAQRLMQTPDVRIVHIEMGGNDVCSDTLPTQEALAVIESYMDATFTYLSDHMVNGAVIVSEVPNVVRVREVMQDRRHFLFDTYQDFWDLNTSHFNSDGVDDICNALYGSDFFCDKLGGDELTEAQLKLTIDQLIQDLFDANFPCQRVLGSGSSDADRQAAHELNLAINALLAVKVQEYDGRNNTAFFLADNIDEGAFTEVEVSKLDGFHLGKAGQEWLSGLIWDRVGPVFALPSPPTTTTTTTTSTTSTTTTTAPAPTTATTTTAPVTTTTGTATTTSAPGTTTTVVSTSTTAASTTTTTTVSVTTSTTVAPGTTTTVPASTSTTAAPVTTTTTTAPTTTTTTTLPPQRAPVIVVRQGGLDQLPAFTVSPGGGLAYFEVTNFDEDEPRNWISPDDFIHPAPGTGFTDAVFVLDPSMLALGTVFTVSVDLGSSADVDVKVAESEQSDADLDGIADFLDDVNLELGELQADVHNAAAGLLRANLGRLTLGTISFKAGGTGARLTLQQIMEFVSGALDTGVVQSCVPDCFDFDVKGLIPGLTVKVVLPLSGPIPEQAVYRKLINGVWRHFLVNAKDGIGSALKNGDCPLPGDTAYTTNGVLPNGLIPGNQCMQLWITDGGDNDGDGIANGVVRDPGGIAIAASIGSGGSSGSGSGGGCSVYPNPVQPLQRGDGWLLVLLITGMWFRRLCGRSRQRG